VLLHKLEDPTGVIFFETNLLESVDAAMASRIHMTIQYRNLTVVERSAIWKRLVMNGANSKFEIERISEADIASLSRVNLDGRTMKNLLWIASLVAEDSGRGLELMLLSTIIKNFTPGLIGNLPEEPEESAIEARI
jgi:hypothetical protein